MGEHESNPDATVAALQLLLGDKSERDRVALLRRAFPGIYVADAAYLRATASKIQKAQRAAAAIMSHANGESPLGMHAQNEISQNLHVIRGLLGTLLATSKW